MSCSSSAQLPRARCTSEPIPSLVKEPKCSGLMKDSNERIQMKGLVKWKCHIRQAMDPHALHPSNTQAADCPLSPAETLGR